MDNIGGRVCLLYFKLACDEKLSQGLLTIIVYNLADVKALSVPTKFWAVLNEVSKSDCIRAALSVVMAP